MRHFNFVLPLTTATSKHVNSGGHLQNATLQKPHTLGLYSTSTQSHMKIGSRSQRLGVGLVRMLINSPGLNSPGFELGLVVGAK